MKVLKIINELPYLFFVTGLSFIVVGCTTLLAGSPLLHTSRWWLVVAVPLIAALSGFALGLIDLRKRGLDFSATLVELTEAINRNKERLP